MKVCCLIREQPHYRADAFKGGLKRVGATFTDERTCDVLVIWNRYGHYNNLADQVEKRGGIVLVAENGYLGNDFCGDRWYAISRTQHNGAGWWPDGGPERWDGLNVILAPFRSEGDDIVVLPQRGIGPQGVAMPGQWAREAVARLVKTTRRRVRVREHPGQKESIPLEHDLSTAYAVATWGSGAAIKALAMGIPVYADFPKWIGAPAATPIGKELNRSEQDRLDMFRRLIWAQWRLSEIETGAAFARLLQGL